VRYRGCAFEDLCEMAQRAGEHRSNKHVNVLGFLFFPNLIFVQKIKAYDIDGVPIKELKTPISSRSAIIFHSYVLSHLMQQHE